MMASADVFVFPSLTDTFGLVMLEAMACGTPVAAFDVPSPIDVVQEGVTGALDNDLARPSIRALTLDRGKCIEAASTITWARTAELFESMLDAHREVYSARRAAVGVRPAPRLSHLR